LDPVKRPDSPAAFVARWKMRSHNNDDDVFFLLTNIYSHYSHYPYYYSPCTTSISVLAPTNPKTYNINDNLPLLFSLFVLLPMYPVNQCPCAHEPPYRVSTLRAVDLSIKRDLLQCQKGPLLLFSKETYYY
jgi:hypothetical protein